MHQVNEANRPGSHRRPGCAGDTQFRKWAQSEYQKGSSTAFSSPAAAISMLGVLVSPQARKTLLPDMMQTTRTLPGTRRSYRR